MPVTAVNPGLSALQSQKEGQLILLDLLLSQIASQNWRQGENASFEPETAASKLANELVGNPRLTIELAIELTKTLQRAQTPILTGLASSILKRRTTSNESTLEQSHLKRPKCDSDANRGSSPLPRREHQKPYLGTKNAV